MPKVRMNGTAKWILVGIALASAGIAIVSGYTTLGGKADANAEHVDELRDEQVDQWIDIEQNNERSIRIEVQMNNIAKNVDKILDKVDRLHE